MFRGSIGELSKRFPSSLAAILLTLCGLVAVGCVDVNVINVSDLTARVRITLPDTPTGYTRLVRPGGSTSTFSNFGGRVTVTVLPDEAYRDLLLSLQEEIGRRLWEDRETLSGADVAKLVDRLSEVGDQLSNLASEGASCSVTASDFSTVTAVLNWDLSIDNWTLSCSVASEES